jgi:hypothetical protein
VTAWCWPQSVAAGDVVEVRGATGDVEVVRDGRAPEVVWRGDAGAIPTDGLRTGMYVVRVGDAPPTAWFAVRGVGPIVLALSTNTWNAYNDTGGQNLYTGAVRLSFERPLAVGMLAKPDGDGQRVVAGREYARFNRVNELNSWHGMAGWAGQERRFVCWAEANGIELAYATNVDLERPGALDDASLLLSVGHDEYWTWGMRDTVESFIGGGGNVAFLSGNTCYWQVRVEDDVMVSYKHRYEEDPVFRTEREHLTTTMWCDPIVDRPETQLTGVTFTRGGYHRIASSVPNGSGGYEVHRPDHWLLEGTGLQRGDLLGAAAGVVGYECDGCELTLRDGIPVDATGTIDVVATAPATPFDRETTPLPLAPGGRYELEWHAERVLGDDSRANQDRLRNGHAVLGSYTRGGTVVTVGCTDWAYGLDDPAVARVTTNIIARLG